MNVLAIGAHPDDLDFGCGGTLLRMAKNGDRVTMCIVTDGRAHPLGDPAQVSARRRGEAQRSADMVGGELVWLGVPDGRLMDDFPTRLLFIELMMRAQPDLIITHPPEDYHSDHVATSQLVMKTVQMAWAPPVELKDQPGLAPLRKPVPVAFMTSASGVNFIPEEYVDVSEVWDTKLQMVLSHKSQFLPGPDYDAVQLQQPFEQYSFARLARVMDEFYGLHCWCRYAEGFRWWKANDRFVARRLLP